MRLFPDHLDYALALGEAQLAAGQPGAALTTLMQLQLSNVRAQVDPRVDAAIARALEDKGEFRAAHDRYDEAIAKGRAIGATLMVARCLVAQSYVKKYLGQPQGVLGNLEAAVEIFSRAGAQLDVADALGAMGWVYRDRGDAHKALALSHDAVSRLIEMGSGTGTAIHLGNLAILHLRSGELGLATARAEASLALSREVDYKEAYGSALVTLGWLELHRGSLDAAQQRAQQASQIAKEDGDRLLSAWAEWLDAEALMLRDELAKSRARHESSLTQRAAAGSNGFVAESRTALGFVALLDHRPADAQMYARQAIPQFRADGQLDGEALALALLSASSAELGRREESLQAANRAETLNRANPYLPVRSTIVSALARTYATLGLRQESEKALAEALRTLSDQHFSELLTKRLELSLAVGRLQIALGRIGDALPTLRGVLVEAKRVGLLQIAHEAVQLCAPYAKGGEPCT
jgi:tetratricopeptide (TPR) repeat protein